MDAILPPKAPPPPEAAADLVAASARAAALIAAGAARRDLDRVIPHAEVDIVRAHALQAARVPAALGGPGAGFRDLAAIMINLAAADPNVAQSLQSHFFFMELLRLEGSEKHRTRLWRQVMGGAVFTNAIAERGRKTPATFATRLAREGEGWRLDGVKHYCTGSLVADAIYVLALDEAGRQMVAVVPINRPGVAVQDDWDGMGQRTTGSGTVRFDGVAVAAGDAFALMLWGRRRTHLSATAQLCHAAIDAGIARGALDDGLRHLRAMARAPAAGAPDVVSEDPYLLHAAGEFDVEARAAGAAIAHAAEALEVAAAVAPDAPAYEEACVSASLAVAAAKAVATAAALRVSEGIFRMFGASATDRQLNLDRHWRNARTHTTHDPVAMKYRALGDFLVNGRPPSLTEKI
ncbi:acyl-CoA dehydrogenase family protein [Xanthobacter pseudotagetidis]|uniref:acyl-CoA dehydrogenase family protein n=1 Tax=Xanthobacter pseudotagetidis TaxID=3119911 RepID=UPI0037286613